MAKVAKANESLRNDQNKTCYGILAAEALKKAVVALPPSTGITNKNDPHATWGSQLCVLQHL